MLSNRSKNKKVNFPKDIELLFYLLYFEGGFVWKNYRFLFSTTDKKRFLSLRDETSQKRISDISEIFLGFDKILKFKANAIYKLYIRHYAIFFDKRYQEVRSFYNFVMHSSLNRYLKDLATYDFLYFKYSDLWPPSELKSNFETFESELDIEKTIDKQKLYKKKVVYLFMKNKDKTNPLVYEISLNTAKYINFIQAGMDHSNVVRIFELLKMQIPGNRALKTLLQAHNIYAKE